MYFAMYKETEWVNIMDVLENEKGGGEVHDFNLLFIIHIRIVIFLHQKRKFAN